MDPQVRWYSRIGIAAVFMLIGVSCAVGIWFWPVAKSPHVVDSALPLLQFSLGQVDLPTEPTEPTEPLTFREPIWPQDILGELSQSTAVEFDTQRSIVALSDQSLPVEFDRWSTLNESSAASQNYSDRNALPPESPQGINAIANSSDLSQDRNLRNVDSDLKSGLTELPTVVPLNQRVEPLASTHRPSNHDWADAPQTNSGAARLSSPTNRFAAEPRSEAPPVASSVDPTLTDAGIQNSVSPVSPAATNHFENNSAFPSNSSGADLNQWSQLPDAGARKSDLTISKPLPSPPPEMSSMEERQRAEGIRGNSIPSQLAAFAQPSAEANLTNQSSNGILSSATQFRLAAQPAVGDHFYAQSPSVDPRAHSVPAEGFDFAPGPCWGETFDPDAANQIYEGKTLNANQRPLLELGRPWYQLGQLSPGQSYFGFHNIITPQLIVFGDFRSALASNQSAGNGESLFAMQANLFFDLKVTSTERFHFNLTPLTQGGKNTRFEFDRHQWEGEWNGDINFGFFEGDLGAITGGAIGQTLPFDLPFALGVMPLLFQNGVWLEDDILGAAVTIPAKNSAALDISNFDVTFFAGFDKIDSAAFENDNDAAKLWGVANFIEALNGYIELDYAYLQDRNQIRDRSYHNLGLGYTRRYGRWLSNSTRMIINAGQSTDGGENTADGVLLLSENSLISANPYTVLPYFNLFAGFDRPQSAARAAAAGGVLRNTGILFETDNLTGYPTLDATANQTYGGALGLSLLPADFSQQLVVETAYVGTMGESTGRNALDDQYGFGMRYQLPISNAVILRLDGMYGWLRDTDDISGVRFEFRHKF